MIRAGVFGYLFNYLVWWVLLISILLHTWCFFKFFPKSKRPRTALVLGNALVTLSLLGAAAMVAETYLRFISLKTDVYGMTLPSRRWLLWRTSRNSWNCRDREWAAPKPAGLYRIALVGDSYVFGWGVDRVEDRFGDRLQARFHAAAPGAVEVLNVADCGWDTRDQVEVIRYITDALGVDEVVLCLLPNDIEELVLERDPDDPTFPPQQSFFNLDSSCLLDYLYRRVYTPYVATARHYHDWLAGGFSDPQVMAEEERLIDEMIFHCSEKNVRFRVALMPFIKAGGTKWDSKAVHATMRAVFERRGVEIVDLLPAIEGRDADDLVVNSDDPHPNEEANRLFAERIWEAFYARLSEPRP